jgi:hypothetical protein
VSDRSQHPSGFFDSGLVRGYEVSCAILALIESAKTHAQTQG